MIINIMNGIKLICQTIRPDPDNDEYDGGKYYKYHYVVVEVNGKKIKVKAVEINGDGTKAGILDSFEMRSPFNK